MLKKGKAHDFMTIVQGFAKANALTCTIPWFGALFAWIPKAPSVTALFKFAHERVAERLPLGCEPTDVFSQLLVEDKVTKRSYNKKELVHESFMLTIAGNPSEA